MGEDRLQLFIASLGSLAGEESRKAKLLFVRNELASYAASNDDTNAFGVLQLCFAIFPPFWPFLYVQRRTLVVAARLQSRRIYNALDVWRDDLGAEAPALVDELARCDASAPRILPAAVGRFLPQRWRTKLLEK